jgi:hypothetical protein
LGDWKFAKAADFLGGQMSNLKRMIERMHQNYDLSEELVFELTKEIEGGRRWDHLEVLFAKSANLAGDEASWER